MHFGIEMTERASGVPHKLSSLKMEIVCEPRKQARLDLDQLSRPRKKSHCYASCVLATPRMANKNARAFEINDCLSVRLNSPRLKGFVYLPSGMTGPQHHPH